MIIPPLSLAKPIAYIVVVAGVLGGSYFYVKHLEAQAYDRGKSFAENVATAREANQFLKAQADLAAAESAHRAQTQAMQSDQEKRINEAKAESAQHAAVAASAIANADRLQHDVRALLADLARRAGPGDQADSGGVGTPAAADSAGVLADVYGELERRAGIYASQADQRRDAGLHCEGAYEVTP